MAKNFITNVKDTTLEKRLNDLIIASKELKFLVGYFYFSSLEVIYKGLKENKNTVLKVLVGLQVDQLLSQIVEIPYNHIGESDDESFERYLKSLRLALNHTEMDSKIYFEQLDFFIQMLENGRLEIKKTKYPNHSKLYLIKFKDNVHGQSMIIGSSNLTKAGLLSQHEFNVEIRDYGFEEAEEYFDDLWNHESIEITDSEERKKKLIEILTGETQISRNIKPFAAYAYVLKIFLEVYHKNMLSESIEQILKENNFKKFSYQIDAVNQALNIINTYNGVIIADVVGLGKSVIASLIAKELGKRGVILCPPSLIGDERDYTGWRGYIRRFKLYDWEVHSIGKLEELSEKIRNDIFGYDIVIIDEAHRFRNQNTKTYELLSEICRGKIVILLTATPFNNLPEDIFSLLKLFIVPGKSGLTLDEDLETRFRNYNITFRKLFYIQKYCKSPDPNKQKYVKNYYKSIFKKELFGKCDYDKIKEKLREISNEIRNIISPVMIRRNRLDLKQDYKYKKEMKELSEVEDPKELFYELEPEQSAFYNKIVNYFSEYGQFTGAIYRPSFYERKQIEAIEDIEKESKQQFETNLYHIMRILLVKRFESSFGAFYKSIERFLEIHEKVYSFIQKTNKYFLDFKLIETVFDSEDDEKESIFLKKVKLALKEFEEKSKTINNKKSLRYRRVYDIKKFAYKTQFLKDIEKDKQLFREIKNEINRLGLLERDPKRQRVLETVKNELKEKTTPKRKVIIFTEYSDTVEYLEEYFNKELGRVLFCKGKLTNSLVQKIIENFDAQYQNQKDDYDVLITTDILSEGVNLHRAGTIINYDIPWNPTRVIQRLGRVNRIGIKVFDKLRIYNLFPSEKGSEYIKVREIAAQKMFLIHNALGEDAKIFAPDEEPTPSALFDRLLKNPEEEGQASFITFIRNQYNEIKQKYPDIIKTIEKLPHRTKTAKKYNQDENHLILVKKLGLAIYSLMYKKNNKEPIQIDFEKLINLIKCDYQEEQLPLSKDFWDMYEKLKNFNLNSEKTRDNDLYIKAINSIKTLLKRKKDELNPEILEFIKNLNEDLKTYKTLPLATTRKLILQDSSTKSLDKLIETIKKLKQRLGKNYLNIIKKRTDNIDREILIAIENQNINNTN